MRIKDLKEQHPAIYKRALECQVEQGNKPNDLLSLVNGVVSGNFEWEKTIEGFDFWKDIDRGNFQVFYDRYPEQAKDPIKFSEKDWSKATDEELIAEAKRRYPKGTVFANKGINAQFSKGIFEPIIGSFYITYKGNVDTTGGNGYAYCKETNRWAEIVSTPNQETPEPKAGDMVEVDDLQGPLKLIQIHGGEAWVCNENCSFIVALSQVSLPQKSELESKITEILDNHLGDSKGLYSQPQLANLQAAMLDICRWGQNNPNAK